MLERERESQEAGPSPLLERQREREREEWEAAPSPFARERERATPHARDRVSGPQTPMKFNYI